jgi:hypothetical protein
LQPHRSRYGLNAQPDVAAPEKMVDLTTLYTDASVLLAQGERVLSTDEMMGIQALERQHPTIPMQPGQVERREFAYIRHGTQTLIANGKVAQGRIIEPTIGPTREEDDFVAHIRRAVASDPYAKLLKRASFTSMQDLKGRVLAFADYFNATIAKPIKWTNGSKPLAA